MLDDAGFPETSIVLSNNIDEMVIWQIITQIKDEADRYGVDPEKLIKRLVYGVGTSLITSAGDPALDGVYKLVAVQKKEDWIPSIKVSESIEKTINPGSKRVWRLYDDRGKAIADLLSLDSEDLRTMQTIEVHHPSDHTKYRSLEVCTLCEIEPLLVQILDGGKPVYAFPSIQEIREVRQKDTDRLYPGVKRLMNPHTYHVSLSQGLWEMKQGLITKHTKGKTRNESTTGRHRRDTPHRIYNLAFPLLRGWYSQWGTLAEESSRQLPGDEIVPQPKRQFTCGITIDAPAADVWPWLVQIGCQRAGWYSYDLLDNGGVRSADRILPEFQKIATGDPIYATRDGKMSFPVAQILPDEALVLGGTMDTKTGKGVNLPGGSHAGVFQRRNGLLSLREGGGRDAATVPTAVGLEQEHLQQPGVRRVPGPDCFCDDAEDA